MHGGKSNGRPIIHGLTSSLIPEQLKEKIERYAEDPEPLNLLGELAKQRALFEHFLETKEMVTMQGERGPVEVPNRFYESTANQIVESVTRTVERIAKILNTTALTAAEITYLQAKIADIVLKYVPDKDRERCATELQSLGGLLSGDSRSRKVA